MNILLYISTEYPTIRIITFTIALTLYIAVLTSVYTFWHTCNISLRLAPPTLMQFAQADPHALTAEGAAAFHRANPPQTVARTVATSSRTSHTAAEPRLPRTTLTPPPVVCACPEGAAPQQTGVVVGHTVCATHLLGEGGRGIAIENSDAIALEGVAVGKYIIALFPMHSQSDRFLSFVVRLSEFGPTPPVHLTLLH